MNNTGIGFNKSHPERAPDEVFIDNTDFEGFSAIGWSTKRRGSVAYSFTGEKKSTDSNELFPVFVKISEIRNSDKGAGILSRHLPVSKPGEYPWADCSNPYDCCHSGCDCWDNIPEGEEPPRRNSNSIMNLFSVKIKIKA